MGFKNKVVLQLKGMEDYDTPLERILRTPHRLFISLVANKEIKNEKKRTLPIEDTLVFVSKNFEAAES